MKKYIFFPLLASSLMLASCGEDYAEKGGLVDENARVEIVEAPEIQPFVMSVILSWAMPENPQYYYTMIEYTDSEGTFQRRKVSKYSVNPDDPTRVQVTIGGFTDTDEHTFTLTHYTYAGNASESVTMTATPEHRSKAKDYLVQDVTFTPIEEGFEVRWENDLDAKVDLVVEYLHKSDERRSVTIDASLPRVIAVEEVPIETDILISYHMVDQETGDVSETLTKTIQTLPTIYDIYVPGQEYIPNSYYGINMMTIEWNDTKNEFVVKTTGTDPYIYTELPSIPSGKKLVFRYWTEKNINSVEIFLNGRAPAPANSTNGTSDPYSTNWTTGAQYKGFAKTKYWSTVVWDLTKACDTKYDFIKNADPTSPQTNKNKIRFDFGGQSTRELHIRNMHWE